ncbi:hypothetical protein TorRG33x02_122850 [Trema orientale]|uniref:Uncharacterized protein n=1 Tax=Trema orientale TaxID=63057 RepID=A0A2P5F2D0_TREOI|nr:hypothetical protein TorRG33x02_122850 [Trema orientale]
MEPESYFGVAKAKYLNKIKKKAGSSEGVEDGGSRPCAVVSQRGRRGGCRGGAGMAEVMAAANNKTKW